MRLILELVDESLALAHVTGRAQRPRPCPCGHGRYELKDRQERRLRTSVGTVGLRRHRLQAPARSRCRPEQPGRSACGGGTDPSGPVGGLWHMERMCRWLDFWLETGLVSPATTGHLERLMRKLGRRLKKIGFGWTDAEAAQMAGILLRRITHPEEWAQYWKKRLRLDGRVQIHFRRVRTVQ